MNEIELEMRGLPRDAVVVTTLRGVAEYAERTGRRALLRGRDWRNWRELRDNWSELSRRVGIAQAIGPEWLCDAVTHFCGITHMNRETSVRRARRWAEYYIRNLILLSERSHAMVRGAAQGRPAVIVGAGPSLDKNGYLLHGYVRRTNAIVIGINAGSLAAPCDATFSVESNDIRTKLAARGLQIFGLASPTKLLQDRIRSLHPVWNGELAWVAEEITHIPRLPTSGSGSSSAISLAHLWGCNPIVLVGHDMAYTDGRVYATATGFGRDRVDAEGRFDWQDSRLVPRPGNPLHEADQLEQVPSWDGQRTVQSGIAFRAIRHFLAATAETYSDTVCINATEGGAAIDGWRPVKLEEAIEAMPHTRSDPPDFGKETIDPVRIMSWLRKHAAKELAEVWAFGEIDARVQAHRTQAPARIPMIEAWHVRRAMRDVERMRDEAEREIRCLVDTL